MKCARDEKMDIVDENDGVIGSATRKEIYEKGHRHRIVHVLVFNKSGEMLLQLRSKKVDFLPRYWSTAAGGHVSSGESYLDAAKRELKEELGITGDLQGIGKYEFYGTINKIYKFIYFYKIVFDGRFNLDYNDVEKVEFFSKDKLRKMIKNGSKIHPELLFYLKKYLEEK
ncbi:MAG: NUDIX domain-containing protein [Candidatus Berkelbacteria bacterium]|nr:NUDIX domain-containing protein [Candidatus Berkelbacteria bacterium]